jgi:hypothetical protein
LIASLRQLTHTAPRDTVEILQLGTAGCHAMNFPAAACQQRYCPSGKNEPGTTVILYTCPSHPQEQRITEVFQLLEAAPTMTLPPKQFWTGPEPDIAATWHSNWTARRGEAAHEVAAEADDSTPQPSLSDVRPQSARAAPTSAISPVVRPQAPSVARTLERHRIPRRPVSASVVSRERMDATREAMQAERIKVRRIACTCSRTAIRHPYSICCPCGCLRRLMRMLCRRNLV